MLPLLLIKYWRVGLIAAGLLGLSGWALWERHALLEEGRQRELTKIEDANHAAEHKADQGSNAVDDCFGAGGAWNRDDGMCEHP